MFVTICVASLVPVIEPDVRSPTSCSVEASVL